jgi:hypothetical protein
MNRSPIRKPGRLDPCPCTSGKRFKDCHGKLDLLGFSIATYHPGMPSPEAFLKLAKETTERSQRRDRLGEIRLPNAPLIAGQRMVGVGGNIYTVDPKNAPLNFMGILLVQTLGYDWCEETFNRPGSPLHPIAEWYRVLMAWQQTNADSEGRLKGKLRGPVMAWFMLAYDVWVLSHYQPLTPLMDRLKDPNQFQGARYELSTYGLFVRGGFTLHPENEKDKLSDHFEFTATHNASGERVAVECKSRHRRGVLGFTDNGVSKLQANPQPGIRRMLRKALDKSTHDTPYIVCIDLNLPPSDAQTGKKILESATREVRGLSMAYRKRGQKFPATMVLLTNHPHHYGSLDELDAADHAVIRITDAAHPFVGVGVSKQVLKGLESYGNLPQSWDDFD